MEDKLSQLQELVQKGERRGLFEDDAIPSEIQRSVCHTYMYLLTIALLVHK